MEEAPELLPGNTDAWMLWEHVRTQWRMGGFGPVGLDYAEARRMARDLGLVWSYGLLKKLQTLEYCQLKRMAPGDSTQNDTEGRDGSHQEDQ